ncbi:phage regulatory CII family protein [Vibrio europaeus]|uniref:phage regulatory CII family protein n=1 Tax=Vibrio europaeus TaxID=300876 RepID=UPI00233E99E7|nr:phage regulatory CII family protein [Vibrio europaeus]MDC5820416.1 phage regulatory CII family protein [Vibrio europaeus]
MNESDSMCELIGTKQLAFNEACCAFAKSENMTKLAEGIGMSPTMLRNKLNPEQPHVLTCVELIAITKASGNHTIVNSLLLGLGVVTAHIPLDATEETFIKRALENSIHSGDLSQMALEYAGKPKLTRAQKYEIVQTVHANISGQVLLLNSLEKLNQGVGLLKAIGRKGGR